MTENSYLERMKQIHSFNNNPRMKDVRDFYNTPSFWQIMNIARRENSHSAFISYYMNPTNHHSLGDSFLRLFLQMVMIRAIEQEKGIDADFAQKIMLSPTILSSYQIPDQEDMSRLKDYVKCLSIPALEDNTHTEKSKSIIMATSNKETKLLMDFWNNNEELIKACLSVIAGRNSQKRHAA